ncbi:TPA: phenylalanine--tRNA ligase subunit alpha, partial [Candidatus Micrarchaeota archaeon]|nr:phenylalanine--tRNA ligase subunit alpha [Candidatus Micrarchaeota archaeon]
MLQEIEKRTREIEKEWEKSVKEISDLKGLEELRVRFLGRKGLLTQLFPLLKELSPEEKAAAGRLLNSLRERI